MQRRVVHMTRHTYEQAKADKEYLFEIGPPNDMMAAYDADELVEQFLSRPTKKTATDILVSMIVGWFSSGPDCYSFGGRELKMSGAQVHIDWGNPRIVEIADRYGIRDSDDEDDD